MKTYRVIVTSQAPFCEPVEWPYGPAQPSKFKALLAIGAALDLHADDDRWTGLQSVRIDVTEVDGRDAEADSCADPESCTEASHV